MNTSRALLVLGSLGSLMSGCLLDVGDDPATVDNVLPKEEFEIMGAHEATVATTTPATSIAYHGGPIMLGTTHVYVIWYGGWSGNTALQIVPAFTQALGGSSYFNINTSYNNSAGAKVSNAITFAGQATDAYSRGKALADTDVAAVVSSAITTNKLPKDAAGIYVVLSSADVNETSGLCSRYCGWHTATTVSGAVTRMAYIGNPDRCPTSCEAQTAKSPNGNPGADGLLSIYAHELDETVTDPNLNAWYDGTGAENADKCAWTFGTTYNAANGSKANVKLGTKDYLIQRNWLNVGTGSCVMAK